MVVRILASMAKKAQTDRFEKNKISGKVYEVKMDRYVSRKEEIKSKMPVLRAKLNILLHKKRVASPLKKKKKQRGLVVK